LVNYYVFTSFRMTSYEPLEIVMINLSKYLATSLYRLVKISPLGGGLLCQQILFQPIYFAFQSLNPLPLYKDKKEL
jgi:hypothetical protein